MAQLIAGVARANITPPVGMLMAGYAVRKTPAVGIHDELNCVVVYLSDGGTEAALITADILDIDLEGTRRIREACTDVAGVPADNVFVNCSHTHGGPQTALDRSGPGDQLKQDYSTVLVYKMAGALAEAKAGAAPVRVGHGRQSCTVAMNRRERKADGTMILGANPDGPTAPYTDVIRLDRKETGEPMAVLFCYACHGTTLQGDNYLYTADYPGAAKRLADAQLPGTISAFVAGCSGDTNPNPRGRYEYLERHGMALGCAVVQAVMEIKDFAEDAPLAVARHEFTLPLDQPPSLDEARARLADLKKHAAPISATGHKTVDELNDWYTQKRIRSAEKLVEVLESDDGEFSVPVETQVLAIGDCAIVGMPGEIFVKIGLEVASRSPFARTLPASHSNGAPGYLPTADQIPLGGYEIERARAGKYGLYIVPESDRLMTEGALAALQSCYDSLHG